MSKHITAKAEPLTGIDNALSADRGIGVKTVHEPKLCEYLQETDFSVLIQRHVEVEQSRDGIARLIARKLELELPPHEVKGGATQYWFNVGHNENTVQGKLVTPIKVIVFEELRDRGHSNPSTAWAQYREAGRELVFGKKERKEKSADGNVLRKFDDRMKDEIVALWSAFNTPKIAAAIAALPPKRQAAIKLAIPLLEQLLVALTGKASYPADYIRNRDAKK
jgi:hypothetical protein